MSTNADLNVPRMESISRPDAWMDTMYLLQLRWEQAVFSHDSALFLHDMTDREPTQYTVTVKTGYNPSNLKLMA